MSASKRDKENRWKKRQSPFRKSQKQIRKHKKLTLLIQPIPTNPLFRALFVSLSSSQKNKKTKSFFGFAKKNQNFLLGLVKNRSCLGFQGLIKRKEWVNVVGETLTASSLTEAVELGRTYGLRCQDSDGRRIFTVVSLTPSIRSVANTVSFILFEKNQTFVTLLYSSYTFKFGFLFLDITQKVFKFLTFFSHGQSYHNRLHTFATLFHSYILKFGFFVFLNISEKVRNFSRSFIFIILVKFLSQAFQHFCYFVLFIYLLF